MKSKFFRWTLLVGLECVFLFTLLPALLPVVDSSVAHAVENPGSAPTRPGDSPQPPPTDSINWKEWGIGLVTSIVLIISSAVLTVVFQEKVKDRVFAWSRYKLKLKGSGKAIYALKGKRLISAGVEEDVNLLNDFPDPRSVDGDKSDTFVLEGCHLNILGEKARLTATLKGYSSDECKWTATVKGDGQYIAKHAEILDGYIYLQCRCEQTDPKLQPGTSPIWAATYIIATTGNPKILKGYWLLRDQRNMKRVSFGEMSLEQEN